MNPIGKYIRRIFSFSRDLFSFFSFFDLERLIIKFTWTKTKLEKLRKQIPLLDIKA